MRSAFLLLLVLSAALRAEISPDTKRIDLGFPGVEHRIPIVFPADYDPSRKWPLVLYYHGADGVPDTGLIRHHTGEEGWFTVGMAYVQRGQFTFTPESLEAELAILRSVRQHLVGKYNVDPKRVYVAGFSKGGWMAGLFLQADPELAGAVILGAGHVHQVKAQPPKFNRRTPVFLGVGREDGNYPFALRAITFYRGLGATTTLDTWNDCGHQFPENGSAALTQWLALEGNPAADHKSAAKTWATERLAEIKAIPDPVNRWAALLDMQVAPYFALLDPAAAAPVTAAREALEKTAAVAVEVKALTDHRTILRTELESHTRENYTAVAAAYLKFANSLPGTRQGTIAQKDHERVTTLLQHFEEQEKLEEDPGGPEPTGDDPFDPKLPKKDRRIPMRPLIR